MLSDWKTDVDREWVLSEPETTRAKAEISERGAVLRLRSSATGNVTELLPLSGTTFHKENRSVRRD